MTLSPQLLFADGTNCCLVYTGVSDGCWYNSLRLNELHFLLIVDVLVCTRIRIGTNCGMYLGLYVYCSSGYHCLMSVTFIPHRCSIHIQQTQCCYVLYTYLYLFNTCHTLIPKIHSTKHTTIHVLNIQSNIPGYGDTGSLFWAVVIAFHSCKSQDNLGLSLGAGHLMSPVAP